MWKTSNRKQPSFKERKVVYYTERLNIKKVKTHEI